MKPSLASALIIVSVAFASGVAIALPGQGMLASDCTAYKGAVTRGSDGEIYPTLPATNMICPFFFPDNVGIGTMKVRYWDDVAAAITISFRRRNLSTSAYETLATLTTSADTPAWTTTTLAFSDIPIDPASYAYYVVITFGVSSPDQKVSAIVLAGPLL